MAPTEFLFYPRLPNELKVMVWEYAFVEWSSGAHRFRLLINPQSPTKLVMRPDNDQKDDASAWRERLTLAKIDSCSEYVFSKLQREAKQRNQLKLLYKDTSYRRRRRVEENGVAANICADTDLVTFRFNYGTTQASLALLSHVENREIFAGITQVGIELDFFWNGYMKTPKYKPFGFQCAHLGFHLPGTCPVGAVNFLRWFKDLKTIYIIFILKCEGKDELSNFLSGRTTVFPCLCASRHKVNQSTLDTFQALQDIAQQRGLKQFHNRYGTYCEFPLEIFELSVLLDELRSEWIWFHETQQTTQGNWKSVQFELLSWNKLRAATVIGNERPLPRGNPRE
ncbi:hypothetical protein F4679DRAFT_240292 [Xylaria curta]|nr:hypothetical protein F4679DRAFT_240292 [Xylaria curta]